MGTDIALHDVLGVVRACRACQEIGVINNADLLTLKEPAETVGIVTGSYRCKDYGHDFTVELQRVTRYEEVPLTDEQATELRQTARRDRYARLHPSPPPEPEAEPSLVDRVAALEQAVGGATPEVPVEGYPVSQGHGYYLLSDGTRFKGTVGKAHAAEQRIQEARRAEEAQGQAEAQAETAGAEA